MTYLDDEEISLRSEYTTNLSYDKFIVFYNADPENWKFIKEGFRECNRHSACRRDPEYVYIPEYTYKDEQGYKRHRYIKFLTRKDYKKFVKFMNKMYRAGEDHENQSEILELANIVGEKSREKLENINKEVSENYNNMISLVNKCSSNYHESIKSDLTSTATSINDSNNSENTFIANKVPYKIFTFKSESYIKLKKNGFMNELDNFGYYRIVRGFYKVSEEAFYNGIVYCKVMDKPERWIRLSSINSKYDMNNNKIR
jgi:hypothetical protein